MRTVNKERARTGETKSFENRAEPSRHLAIEADPISKIFVLGPWRLAKHFPRRESVANTTSEMNRKGHDQVAAPRTKAR